MRFLRVLMLLSALAFASSAMAQSQQPYPKVDYLYNWSDTIVEDQVFVALFNTEVDAQSVADNSYCHVQGLGEQVATRLIVGKQRAQILDSFGISKSNVDSQDYQLLQCKRLLPANAKVRLTIGPQIKTANQELASTTPFWREFKVRDRFRVSFSCTRTNSKAPCSPLFPVSLSFSSPVAKDKLAQVVLRSAGHETQAIQITDPDESTYEGLVSYLSFPGPFQENTYYSIHIPAALSDDAGRSLSNQGSFPLSFTTDSMPPLVKFTSGDFGIIERFANGAPGSNPDIIVPIAMRKVSASLLSKELKISAGASSDFVVRDATQAIRWLARINRMKSGSYTSGQLADIAAGRKLRSAGRYEPEIDVRSKSIFSAKDVVHKLKLPGLQDETAATAEIIGLPVEDPGLHIIEIASPELGSALLEDKPANSKMYVRSAVLVSNLSVHLKTGRDDVLVWVTALDDGKPVANADVAVLDCNGEPIISGQTDATGVWHEFKYIDTYKYCAESGLSGVYASASIAADHPQAFGKADFALVSSRWDDGIEPWRFNLPYSTSEAPDLVAHAVLDRTLFRVGETVSMKLFVRELDRNGWSNYFMDGLEGHIIVSHLGTGEEYKIPVDWQTNSGGGIYALAEFKTNNKADLGEYSINVPLVNKDNYYWGLGLDAGSFRVEEFKLPLLEGSIKLLADNNANKTLIAPKDLSADIQIGWIAGGAASDLDISLSAMARPLSISFTDYADYSFQSYSSLANNDNGIRKLILDKQPVKLDANGSARVEIKDLPMVKQSQNWLFEATFKDPNGQMQTISQSQDIWPADIAVGIKSGYWFNQGDTAKIKLLVLDSSGSPVANKDVQLEGELATTYTSRKRLVGGFYAYDSHEQKTALGTLCSGKTAADGVLECAIDIEQTGEVRLYASATDDQGNQSKTATTIQVWGDGTWFSSSNNDRIDVIADKPQYKPGDIAELAVQMPFRQAQALVAIEREGVLATEVHKLQGDNPVIKLKIDEQWGPNVYVSVLAVRGRIRSVPWASFFDWGWRHPWQWLDARSNQDNTVKAPTAFVDLAKPAYKFGIAKLKISDESDRLDVKVSTDHATYQIRDTIKAEIQANLPDGKPAAGAGLAVAVVDKALLELYGNDSWGLLQAMRTTRSYGVSTATAQSEVVGRRHYGRKAVPAGGGGGQSISRELFDTLLYWRGDISLDSVGKASVEIPTNDSITSFRIVAIADYGEDKFGTGQLDIATTQDLQIISGLPQIIREADNYSAQITLRNRTQDAMAISVDASYEYPADKVHNLAPQQLQLDAGKSAVVSWDLSAPDLDAAASTIQWHFRASANSATDSVSVQQKLLPQVEIKPFKAELIHLKNNQDYSLALNAPENSLIYADGRPKGGVDILLQADLAGSLPGVYAWLQSYPYTCIEQQSAKYIGMQDPGHWQQLMADLPSYLSDEGLLSYFPNGSGNINLTAHMVELTELAQVIDNRYKLLSYGKEAMLAALQDFINGKLNDNSWLPRSDDNWRELNVLSALARAGAIQKGMLDKFIMPVSDWPTPALVSWFTVLHNYNDIYQHDKLLAAVNQALDQRISRHGTTAILNDQSVNDGWWLMSNQAVVQAKFLLAALQDPYWQQDLTRIFNGLLNMQTNGHWGTTTANVFGSLAVQAFARQEQGNQGVGHITLISGQASEKSIAWSAVQQQEQLLHFDWPVTAEQELRLQQDRHGDGWLTIIAKAAIPYATEANNGISIKRSIRPISQSKPGVWSVGDVYRVRLKLNVSEAISWAAVTDPVPAGAAILGTGLGRDSAIAVSHDAELSSDWWRMPSYIERASDTYRAYYEYLSAGEHTIEYTVRLNAAGEYNLPATRVESLYQPDIFGIYPNQPFIVSTHN